MLSSCLRSITMDLSIRAALKAHARRGPRVPSSSSCSSSSPGRQLSPLLPHAAATPHSTGPDAADVARQATSPSAASSSSEGGGAGAAALRQPAKAQKPSLDKSRFCRMCGSPMLIAQPEGDSSWRHVCSSCSYVDYFNPKLVVGCIVEHQGQILLCKRAIAPCQGMWTVPAGFLEIGESCAAGAVRETWEEAQARVEVLAPYTHLDIPVIGQAYILFRARLAAPFTFSAGPESLDVRLFDPRDVPFEQMAFSSVTMTLRHYLADLEAGTWHIHHGVIQKAPGTAPNDPGAFALRDHFAIPISPAL